MPLQIEENTTPPADFDWGKSWRAVRIWKEARDDDDYLYAYLIAYYGPDDYGNKKSEELYIGREVTWVQPKTWDTDRKSKTFNQRITPEADTVTEDIWDEKKGTYVPVKTAINATKKYKFLHKANDPEIIKKYKTLVGKLPAGSTRLYFVYNNGDRVVPMDNPDDFWNHPVKELINIEMKKVSIFATEADKQKAGRQDVDVQEQLAPPPTTKAGQKHAEKVSQSTTK